MVFNYECREMNDQGIDLQKVYNKARNETSQAHQDFIDALDQLKKARKHGSKNQIKKLEK